MKTLARTAYCFAVLALTSIAAPAAIVNANFDADVLPNGSFTCSGTTGFTGWNSYGGGCGTGLNNPDSNMFPGGVAPSEGNVAYLNGTVGYWQALSDLYSQSTYTFDIMIGQRLDEPFGGYTLELRSGSGTGPLLASVSGTTGPGPGNWMPASVSYAVGAGDAALGQNIVVAFRGLGTQTSFDNATLTSAPEPSTYAMIGSALIGLAFLRRQRDRE